MAGEELEGQRRIVEALIVASEEPIAAAKLADIVPDCTAAQIRTLVDELNAEYEAQSRAFEIWEVAGGYQMRTRSVYAGYILQLQSVRPVRLSKAALETLAIVAYKQPLTRAEIEHIRGVDVSNAVRLLVERQLLRTDGHREVPGRPMLYATTKEFLELFGFASLKDLPTLRDVQELIAQEAPDAAVTQQSFDLQSAEAVEDADAPAQASESAPDVAHARAEDDEGSEDQFEQEDLDDEEELADEDDAFLSDADSEDEAGFTMQAEAELVMVRSALESEEVFDDAADADSADEDFPGA